MNSVVVKSVPIGTVNGMEIFRSVWQSCASEDEWFDNKPTGRRSVFYDVCDGEWLLESFKTLREAKKYCEN